jgi:hypothetical protein
MNWEDLVELLVCGLSCKPVRKVEHLKEVEVK